MKLTITAKIEDAWHDVVIHAPQRVTVDLPNHTLILIDRVGKRYAIHLDGHETLEVVPATEVEQCPT